MGHTSGVPLVSGSFLIPFPPSILLTIWLLIMTTPVVVMQRGSLACRLTTCGCWRCSRSMHRNRSRPQRMSPSATVTLPYAAKTSPVSGSLSGHAEIPGRAKNDTRAVVAPSSNQRRSVVQMRLKSPLRREKPGFSFEVSTERRSSLALLCLCRASQGAIMKIKVVSPIVTSSPSRRVHGPRYSSPLIREGLVGRRS